jgi:hypothetical protein
MNKLQQGLLIGATGSRRVALVADESLEVYEEHLCTLRMGDCRMPCLVHTPKGETSVAEIYDALHAVFFRGAEVIECQHLGTVER